MEGEPAGAATARWWITTGVPERLQRFETGSAAATRRLASVQPAEYARSRNAIDGAVTGLSPYLTHGVLSLGEAIGWLRQRHPLDAQHKLVFEFAWREFFHHVWRRAGNAGDAILADMRPSAAGAVAYANELPVDVREGRTGVPAIDTAVRVLYRSGYLHNHARMWLASYVVHLRKVHWRAGADWMIGHLLDGDLASNHLSWQWVAGTFSTKPYLFNADNVARYAPAGSLAAWASHGTAIDRSYEALEDWARRGGDCGPEPGCHDAIEEPALLSAPPDRLTSDLPRAAPAQWAGRAVEIVHPWALSARSASQIRIGLVHLPAHGLIPWSERRWRWVIETMAAVCDAVHVGDAATLDMGSAASVHAVPVGYPGYRQWLTEHTQAPATTAWLIEPQKTCASFSRFYRDARETRNARATEARPQSGPPTDTLTETPWPSPTPAPPS